MSVCHGMICVTLIYHIHYTIQRALVFVHSFGTYISPVTSLGLENSLEIISLTPAFMILIRLKFFK